MGSNGLTSARHDVLPNIWQKNIPKAMMLRVPEELVYSGGLKLTDAVEGSPIDAGKLVLSPTRTYAPVVKKLLDALRPEIHGMVHCSGGAQTKVLHFVGDVRVVKTTSSPCLHCSEPFRNKVEPTGQKCIRYSTWAIALKYTFHPNTLLKLSRSANLSVSLHKSWDASKKAIRKN